MGNFWPEMMGGYGMGWGFAWVFMLFWWVLIIVGIVLLVRWLVGSSHNSHPIHDKTALDILKERYARGEINRETYEQMRRDLTGQGGRE